MALPLTHLSISAPGFFGLNRQDEGDVLPPGWATEALNCVIDKSGRLASRNGYQEQHATALDGVVKAQIEYRASETDTLHVMAAGAKIYSLDGGTVTDITGTITTPTDSNWQFINFNGKLLGWQKDHEPIVLSSTSGTFADIVPSGGSEPQGDAAIDFFGRMFVTDGQTLYWSDILDETGFNGAGAGSLDLRNVWEGGADTATALAEFNGFLVIFGKKQVVIYEGAEDPNAATFVKREAISQVGCIARDSVQAIEEDLIFLSESGIRSLGRELESKIPILDLSRNYRDYLVNLVSNATESEIKSTFNASRYQYLLRVGDRTLALDLRRRLPDQTFRTTEWDLAPDSMAEVGGQTYFGTTGNFVSLYSGYLDGVDSAGLGGSTYTYNFEGVWNDFAEVLGQEVTNRTKIPKKATISTVGGAGYNVLLKYAFDFSFTFNSVNIPIPSGDVAEFGIAEFGIGEYSGNTTFNELGKPLARSGRIIKAGVQTTINGNSFALNRIYILAKLGRQTL